MRFFFALFVLLPLLELFILIKVGDEIGALPTIGLVMATAVVGLALLRQQGYSTLMRAREKVAQGQVPAEEMLGGFFVALGGFLLLLPGLITDVIGLCCLIAPLRKLFLKGLLQRWIVSEQVAFRSVRGGTHRNQESGRVIEGEFERDERKDPRDS